jgi:uncharacterized protein YndB with AHSA1/START domain
LQPISCAKAQAAKTKNQKLMTTGQTVFSKDFKSKRLTVERAFNAPLKSVWEAWTDSTKLDQWWAPKPYRAETKTMDFRVGGGWLYTMIGPKGDTTLCRVTYTTIEPLKSITSTSEFCDDAGLTNPDLPAMHWKIEFNHANALTTVKTGITFAKETDMQMIISMGFQEGYTMGLGNLEAYLKNSLAL